MGGGGGSHTHRGPTKGIRPGSVSGRIRKGKSPIVYYIGVKSKFRQLSSSGIIVLAGQCSYQKMRFYVSISER